MCEKRPLLSIYDIPFGFSLPIQLDQYFQRPRGQNQKQNSLVPLSTKVKLVLALIVIPLRTCSLLFVLEIRPNHTKHYCRQTKMLFPA